MALKIACNACGTVHECADLVAAKEIWCSMCGCRLDGSAPVGSLVAAPAGAGAPIPIVLLRAIDQFRLSRPASVVTALVAGAVAILVEARVVLATVGGMRATIWASPLSVIGVSIFDPWWLFLLVWLGLRRGSHRAWRIARLGSAVMAIIFCNIELSEQITTWGPAPTIADVCRGTLHVLLRCAPLFVVFAALMTASAERYYGRAQL